MYTNECYGYDKLLSKDDFYMDVIYANLVKSAGIFFYQEDYARARINGNTIEDVVQQAFYQAYKPYERGGNFGNPGETMYDYYGNNFHDVKEGRTRMVPDYQKDDKGNYVYEVYGTNKRGKEMKRKIQIGEHEELVKPCLNFIRQYMNLIVRNVLKDMCKVAENQKTLVSFDSPVSDEENSKTHMDLFINQEDEASKDIMSDFKVSIKDNYLVDIYGRNISVLDIVSFLESGCSTKEVSQYFNISEFDILNFFNENIDLLSDCFGEISSKGKTRLVNKVKRAKRELSKAVDDLMDSIEDLSTVSNITIDDMLS